MTVATLEAPARRYGLVHVVRAERTKLFSLRSTFWTMLVTFAGSLAVTVLSATSAGHHTRAWYQGFDPTNQSLAGLMIAVLSIGVLGTLAMTGEYGSGTMRSTLAAAPRRPLLLGAKAVVVGVVTLLAGEVLAFCCFGVGQLLLTHGGAPTASLDQAGVLRAVALSGAYLALLALAALGLGLIVRHTAGALAAYAGLTFLLPVILQRISGHAGEYTPLGLLANSVAAVRHQQSAVPAPLAFALMALYAAVLLTLGGVLLVRRDA